MRTVRVQTIGFGAGRLSTGLALAVVLTLAACSSGDDGSAATSDTSSGERATAASGSTETSAEERPAADVATTEPASTESETSAPPRGEAGLFDFNDDGEKERTCGTADFAAGLTVRTYCEDLSGYANDPAAGATLLPGALFRLPSPPDDPRDVPITSGASVSPQHLQAADGGELVVFTLTSDTVFETGSDTLLDPAIESLTTIANGLAVAYRGSSFEVRAHTDAVGEADANLALSERRAARVADFLVSRGYDARQVRSVGLGETMPNYAEDGDLGRDQNRRIEIVVRL